MIQKSVDTHIKGTRKKYVCKIETNFIKNHNEINQ